MRALLLGFLLFFNSLDRLTIDLGTSINQVVNLRVLDLSGRVVRSDKLSTNGNQATATIDVTFLPQGVYLVELTGGQQKTITKIIKE